MKHKPITARKRRKHQAETSTYTQPAYDGVAATLKKLRRYANALSYVRGIVRATTGKCIEGDQVKRIIASGLALALLMPTDALAQARTYYDSAGRVSGRSNTGTNGATTYYDASGRVTARASTGSNGTTTIYGADGRRVGTVTTQQKREKP